MTRKLWHVSEGACMPPRALVAAKDRASACRLAQAAGAVNVDVDDMSAWAVGFPLRDEDSVVALTLPRVKPGDADFPCARLTGNSRASRRARQMPSDDAPGEAVDVLARAADAVGVHINAVRHQNTREATALRYAFWLACRTRGYSAKEMAAVTGHHASNCFHGATKCEERLALKAKTRTYVLTVQAMAAIDKAFARHGR